MSAEWDQRSLRQTATPALPAADFFRAVAAWRDTAQAPSELITYVDQAEQVARGAMGQPDPAKP